MARHDVIAIGGGVSGCAFAAHASRAGRSALILERAPRIGGCLHTERMPSGFWLELGAHTCYNSYGALLELLEGCGLLGELQARAKPVMRFLDGEALVPGQNLGALLRLLDKGELLGSLPRLLGASQEGETVYSYYGRIVGKRNYARVIGPVLSAVPSQSADGFPADMLFKKRPRRKEILRSFTLRGGLRAFPEAVARLPRVTARTGAAVESVEAVPGGWAVRLEDGSREECEALAVATPPGEAARLLRGAAPEVAAQAARVREVVVDTLGVVVRAEAVSHLPRATFLIPLDDRFHSVVTRDVVPDPERRGFAFHFKPGLGPGERLGRAARVLGIDPSKAEAAFERRTVLPSPVLGHREVVREIDRLLAGTRLAVTGNWFAGLSIEDCVQRSRDEWKRVAGT